MSNHTHHKHSFHLPVRRLSIAKDELNFEDVDPGTIRIDCSGAYIANDDLLKDNNMISDANNTSSSASPSSTTTNSSCSSSSEEEDTDIDDGTKESVEMKSNIRSNNNITLQHSNQLAHIKPPQPTDEDVSSKNNINLPQHNSEIIHMSIDIGGTLTKLVYFSRSPTSQLEGGGGGKLHFRDFQTTNFKQEALKFIIKLVQKSFDDTENPPITYIMATGGGAHKFYNLMTKKFKKYKLPMKIIAKDEMECLIRGLDWLITKIPNEIFTYDLIDDKIKFISNSLTSNEEIYPYLLVNIGSGVSMIKVTGPGPEDFQRIGGSTLGGGTLWGLLSLLTDAKDYSEMLEMAERGNNENIDLLVGDIYGTNYNKIGLKAHNIASSFAKVFKTLRFNNKPMTPAEKLAQFRPEDIARSLLFSISNNIGQIAYLQALRFGLKRVYFGGSYISGHMQTIHTLSYAVNFWSKGDMQSYFLRHEGYLGSVGAFVMGPAVKKS
ncbi:uncharacterized protein J8A68_000323 [[Candida] subhashii]|uniref:Pantothenate kinase n=1 Tax=[Candida] subhashii TaxID=561895 RepID=A0A8J5QWL4_9ASCO|nr:uncharacterized protein J8A68_000323 [[Candida] subhashii]KAG7666067.1 hypothetical protein J8A68_000323 [[Candida] subhashii]